MSSVIVVLDQHQAILGTDTLGTSLDGSRPSFLTSKADYLPHMRLLITGSGPCGFLDVWRSFLQNDRFYLGVESMSRVARVDLKRRWEIWRSKSPWPPEFEQEQMVCYFGPSEFDGEMLGFVHYSWNDFEPEEISYRVKGEPTIFARPACDMPQVDGIHAFPKAFLSMMLEQRDKQQSGAYGDAHDRQIRIGGELNIHHLQGALCGCYTLARFDDYNDIVRGLSEAFRTSQEAIGGA